MVKTRCFYLICILISIIFGIFVVCRINFQSINLPQTEIVIDQKIDHQCVGSVNCDASITSSKSLTLENIDLSEISKQLESFDNFFPLSAIAKLNLTASSSLDGNVFIEISKPQYSEKIQDIEVSCANKDNPHFDSKAPQKNLGNISPRLINKMINTMVLDYLTCEKQEINFSYKPAEEKIEIAPNETVKYVVRGDKIIVVQQHSILLELDIITKIVIFLVTFFLSLAAGNILYLYLNRMGFLNNEK
jgi:hypothetical protein